MGTVTVGAVTGAEMEVAEVHITNEKHARDADRPPPPKGAALIPWIRSPQPRHGLAHAHTCRSHGCVRMRPCTRFAGITPLASDQHCSLLAAGPCLKQQCIVHAKRRRMSGLYAFRRLRMRTHPAAATAGAPMRMPASPLPRSSPAASLGIGPPGAPASGSGMAKGLETPGRRSKAVCRNPRLAAPRGR